VFANKTMTTGVLIRLFYLTSHAEVVKYDVWHPAKSVNISYFMTS